MYVKIRRITIPTFWEENSIGRKIRSWIQTFAAIDTFESYISFHWLNIKVSLVIKLVVSRRPQRHSRSPNLVCSNYLTNSLLRKICDGNGHTNVKNMIIDVTFNSTLHLLVILLVLRPLLTHTCTYTFFRMRLLWWNSN